MQSSGFGKHGHNVSETPTSNKADKGPVLLLSPGFSDWLASTDVCLALTTYQAGRLFFIGRKLRKDCVEALLDALEDDLCEVARV